jgi:hypothetical protein
MASLERVNRMLVEDIKGEVMAELQRSQRGSGSYQNQGYQAYCQLVDAVKHDILHQLGNQAEWRQVHQSTAYGHSGYAEPQLSRAEMDLIKREVLRDLQVGMEGEGQRMTAEQ